MSSKNKNKKVVIRFKDISRTNKPSFEEAYFERIYRNVRDYGTSGNGNLIYLSLDNKVVYISTKNIYSLDIEPEVEDSGNLG